MNEEIELAKLSNKELREVTGGGPLFRMLCLYVYINRETIWENTVGQYIEGFRDGYSSVVNQ